MNANGVPDPLWLAAIAHEYGDAIRFRRPPAAVIRPLAAVARRTGRDPRAPELHGPECTCAIADPREAGLEALLSRRVGARAARGHG